MKEFILTDTLTNRAVLVGLITPKQNEKKLNEFLNELEFLAQTIDIKSINRFTQRLSYANPISFVGEGKLREIKEFIEKKEKKIDTVIFDDELTSKQLHNIESVLQIKIIDRTSLILDIFASRAKTAHAKTQVELAQYNYMLPRLTRLWTHLERQSGSGSGGFRMRGPGETQLETDRRIILHKIVHLKKKIKAIDKQKVIQKNNREQMVRVTLVGYTNAGKSTLMNLLSKSEVFTENKLFATLDTTIRKVRIHNNLSFLLADTVGFIRKLPTELIESFKSTLNEVREADLLIHVVDLAHPFFEEQLNVVNQTLREITKEEKLSIIVFNKTDIFFSPLKRKDNLISKNSENISLKEMETIWKQKLNKDCIFISAREKQNIEALKILLYNRVEQIYKKRFPLQPYYLFY